MTTGHPKRIEDFTPEWLTRALREGGVCRHTRVTGFDTRPLTGEGVGFLSGIVRVRLTYDRSELDAPASVVVKLPTYAETNRQLGDSLRAYEREARFYREIAPRSRIRAPRCYCSVLDPAQGDFVLVMEDLSGLTIGDQVKGLTVDQAMAAISMIGPFHAQWWNQPALSELPWMPFENLDLHHLFAQHWPAFRQQFHDWLMPDEIAVGDRLNWQGDRLAQLLAHVPRTIVHWDYRADNLIFDDRTSMAPVVVLDWQLAQRSLGAYDIARLVCGSLPTGVQTGRHREFVACWHEALRAGGVPDYSQDQAWRDFRIGILACLYNPVSFHRVMLAAGSRGKALAEAMIHRFFHAAVECDACAVLDV
jgi:aminoglycoside/choline kinase family phosphotransferase